MTFLMLLIFALELWVGETQGDTAIPVERDSRVLAAALLAGVLILAYVFLLGRSALKRGTFPVHRPARPAFWIVAGWSVVAFVAALQGYESGYDPNFILGDLFKFCLLPLLFLFAYFGIRKPDQLEGVLKACIVVFGVALLLEFFLSYAWVRQGGRFANSVSYHIATVEPLIFYFFITRKGGALFRAFLWFTAAEALAAIVLLQGLSDYIYVLAAAALFVAYFRRKKLALALLAFVILAYVGFQDPFQWFGYRGSYASHKLQLAEDSATAPSVSVIERLSGSRAAETVSVVRAYRSAPQNLLLGFGMGSLIEALPLTNPHLAKLVLADRTRWVVVKHFIHSALAEVLYRTGVLGFAALLLFFAHLYNRGWKLSHSPHRSYGLFAMANCVFQILNLLIQSPLTFVWLILVLTLVGTYVLESAPVPGTVRARYQFLRSPQLVPASK